MRRSLFSLLLLPLFLLTACGPKEIGEGSSVETFANPRAEGSDVMRLPMTGMNKTQRLLYWHNRPDVWESVQKWRLGETRRMMGIAPPPEDPAYRETPKERSPFKQ